MSLPRRPSHVGLPSNPRARSTVTRSDIPSRPPSSASERPPAWSYGTPPPVGRTIHQQRSVIALPSRPSNGSVRSRSLDRRSERPFREVVPPVPDLPRGPRMGVDRPRGRSTVPAGTHASGRSGDYDTHGRRHEEPVSDSGSSSGVSEGFVMSARSSRTSMEDMEMEGDKAEEKVAAGFGSSLWGSLAGVAGNLTISVSKAWSTKVANMSGEETPVGEESRLTRAMKAYHIEKAQDPSELPEWLFDERERGVRGGKTMATATATATTTTTRKGEHQAVAEDVSGEMGRRRIARGPTLADRAVGAESGTGSKEHVSKSMNRLRELRDAKRNAKVRFDGEEAEAGARVGTATAERVGRAETLMLGDGGGQRARRIGLPSGVRPVRA